MERRPTSFLPEPNPLEPPVVAAREAVAPLRLVREGGLQAQAAERLPLQPQEHCRPRLQCSRGPQKNPEG